MKSLPVPVAKARENIAEVLETARRGGRVRITRHGKAVGWVIGEKERNRLDQRASPEPTVAKRRARTP
jgi:prevent-host-death family protein